MTAAWQVSIVALAILVFACAAAHMALVARLRREGTSTNLNASGSSFRWTALATRLDPQRTTLVAFLSTSCPHCFDFAAKLRQVHRERPDQAIVGVVRGDASAFAEATGLDVPLLSDGADEAFTLYEVQAWPEVLLLGPEGDIRDRLNRLELDELRLLIARAGETGYPEGEHSVDSATLKHDYSASHHHQPNPKEVDRV